MDAAADRPEFAPPQGSYRRDCSALLVYGDLFAECRAPGGGLRYSRLPKIAQCEGDIRNADGRLAATCVRHFRRLSRLLQPPKRRVR